MANVKISALTAATTLAGTETLPVVQGGVTVKATITQVLAAAAPLASPTFTGTPAAPTAAAATNTTQLATTAFVTTAVASGGGAPTNADYITETANASLSAESVLGTTVITTATDASKQAAAKAGRLFLPSNGFTLQRDTGSAWVPWGPLFPLTAPPTTGWSWDNQGSATVTTTNGGLVLAGSTNASADVRAYYRTAPTAPYTITAMIIPSPFPEAPSGFGLGFRESSSGKLAFVRYQVGSGIIFDKWTTSTSFSGNYTFYALPMPLGAIFIRIADNNTNRICSLSHDGVNFVPVYTIGRTDFLTADQVCIMIRETTNYPVAANLLSWVAA